MSMEPAQPLEVADVEARLARAQPALARARSRPAGVEVEDALLEVLSGQLA
jgi:hypothetical protein